MIDTQTILALLGNSQLFRGIPHSTLTYLIKQSMQMSLHKGELLLSPGKMNEHVYIILDGQLAVHLTSSTDVEPIALLKPGECVGEMSVLVDRQVSAYVTATMDTQVLAIGYSAFWGLLKGSNAAAFNMLNILVQRIRSDNEAMAKSIKRSESSYLP